MPSGHEFLSGALAGLGFGGLFAVVALGLSLVFGVMRLVNLAHGEFMVLGSYLAFYFIERTGADPLLSALVVVPIVALIAYPTQRFLLSPVMSKGAEAPLLITFGLSVIMQNVFIVGFNPDVRSLNAAYAQRSLSLLGLQFPAVYLISLTVGLLLLGAAHLVLTRTAFGRRLRASSEDPVVAEVMGVNVQRTYALTYAIAAGTAALGGVLIGLMFSFSPTSGTAYLITGFAVVVLGGAGSIKGTLIGALALGMVESLGAVVFGDGWRDLLGFLAFLVILSVRPQGLFGGKR